MPKSICTCGVREREEEKIKVFVEKRRFGKLCTIIEGITSDQKNILSSLKSKLACGGTFKNNRIELQGDHRKKIKQLLAKFGYKEDQIEII